MNRKTREKLERLLEKSWIGTAAALCIAILFYYFIQNLPVLAGGISFLIGTISSMTIGIILAYLINPICVFFEKKVFGGLKNRKTAHTGAVILSILLVLLVLVLILVILIPALAESLNTLISNLSNYIRSADRMIEELEAKAAVYNIDLSAAADKASDWIDGFINHIPDYISGVAKKSFQFGSSMVSWMIGLIFAVYFLAGKEGILNEVSRLRRVLVSEETIKRHNTFLAHCDDIMTHYVGYTLIDALIVGLCNAVFMVVFNIPYASLVSFIVAITNLIPTFGPIIGGVLGGFLLVLHNPVQALMFIIFTLLLQTLDGYVIKPRLFSGSLGVSSVLILASVIIGGELFGIAGIILAIPAAAIITYIYKDLIFPRLQMRRQRIDAEEAE